MRFATNFSAERMITDDRWDGDAAYPLQYDELVEGHTLEYKMVKGAPYYQFVIWCRQLALTLMGILPDIVLGLDADLADP